MVWQVRENGHSNHDIEQNHQTIKTTATIEHVEKKISSASSKLEVESRSSRGSSSSKSVDLGPAPGSGIVTASVSDISEASDNESGNGNGQHLPSMGVEMTESMTLNSQQMAPSSLMQFNQDVESMLQHSAMRVAMNQSSSNNETSKEPEAETSKLEVESRSSRGSSSSKSVDLGPREDFTQHY